MTDNVRPHVKFVLHDGNSFELLAQFSAAAQRQGWTPEDAKALVTEAMTGNRPHLVATIAKYCEFSD